MESCTFTRAAPFRVNLFALPTKKVSTLFITYNLVIAKKLVSDTLG